MVAMGYFDLILYLSHSNQTLAWQPKYKYGMGSSEIWDKYHSLALKCKFHSASPHEILLIFNATPVVFIPISLQHLWYLSQISLLPILLLVLISTDIKKF